MTRLKHAITALIVADILLTALLPFVSLTLLYAGGCWHSGLFAPPDFDRFLSRMPLLEDPALRGDVNEALTAFFTPNSVAHFWPLAVILVSTIVWRKKLRKLAGECLSGSVFFLGAKVLIPCLVFMGGLRQLMSRGVLRLVVEVVLFVMLAGVLGHVVTQTKVRSTQEGLNLGWAITWRWLMGTSCLVVLAVIAAPWVYWLWVSPLSTLPACLTVNGGHHRLWEQITMTYLLVYPYELLVFFAAVFFLLLAPCMIVGYACRHGLDSKAFDEAAAAKEDAHE